MEHTTYQSQPRELRFGHVDLNTNCTTTGNQLTTSSLASALGLTGVPDDKQPVQLCCELGCTNPRHYVFCNRTDGKWINSVRARHRVKVALESDLYRHSSEATIAAVAQTSRNVVRRYIAENRIVREEVVGADGRSYPARYASPLEKAANIIERLADTELLNTPYEEAARSLAHSIHQINTQ